MFSDAVRIILNEGISSLAGKSLKYGKRELSKQYIRLSPPLPQKTTTVEVNGVVATFSVSSPISVERTNHLMGEKPVVSKVISEVQPDDVFYDIGANIGIYSCLISKVLTQGEVVAFEPSSSNVVSLAQNVSNNGSNITIAPVALADFTGLVGFELDGDHPGVGTHSISKADGSEMRVGVFSGEQLISQGDLPAPDVLKIDVEGAELSVLRGLQDQFSDIRMIFCEIHGGDTEEVQSFLRENGFDIEVILDRESEQFIHAFKTG